MKHYTDTIMNMQSIALIFLALAVLFAVLSFKDYTINHTRTPAQKTWMRIAVIFAIVSIMLTITHIVYF